MGTPVVVVASGGMAVMEAADGYGMPVMEVDHGYGAPVTVVSQFGLPVVFVSGSPGGSDVTSRLLLADGTSLLLVVNGTDHLLVAEEVVTPPVTYATFNGTPSANVAVTNGGLTVTHGSTAASTGVRSTALLSTGKYYFEITLQTSTTSGNFVGIILSSGSGYSSGTMLSSTTSVNLGSGTDIYSNGVSQSKNLGEAMVGSVFSFAIDLNAKRAWIRRDGGNWNNDVAANPETGVNGIIVAAGNFAPFVRFASGNATDTMTANFGQSAFIRAAPPSFTSGWPA